MLKRLKDEQGAALLLVLFIIIVFTMIGMAVLSASIGGAVRSQTKQKDVQSVHLAEKALNEAVAMIQGMLAGQKTINLDLFPGQLDDIVTQINHHQISTEYDEQYGAQPSVITNAELVKTDYPQTIKISVTASIQGVTRKLEQKLEVNPYPDALKFAAGSEEGNLIINGSPHFIGGENGGSLYAGKRLLIKNEAEYFYEGVDQKRESTGFPTLEGTAYVQSLSNILYCDTSDCIPNKYIRESSGDSNSKKAETILGELSKTQTKSSKDFIGINMEESFVDKLTEAIGGGSAVRETIQNLYKQRMSDVMDYLIASQRMAAISPLAPTGNETTQEIEAYTSDLTKFKNYVNNNLRDGSVLYRGDFNLNQFDYTNLVFATGINVGKTFRVDTFENGYSQSNWFIIDGDLNITNTVVDVPIQVRANILVTGNVHITGNVKMDSTIFALGHTVIEDASIVGLEGRELVLMSKGDILITRVNTNGPGSFKNIEGDLQYDLAFDSDDKTNGTIQRLDAFFYTDSKAELYGVGSIFWIRGGFFSKGDLTINAVRGSAEVQDGRIESEPNQTSISDKRARFIISYNNEIVDHQAAALPRVKAVQLIRGKRKMVDH